MLNVETAARDLIGGLMQFPDVCAGGEVVAYLTDIIP